MRRGAIWCVNWCVEIFPNPAKMENIGKNRINGTLFVSNPIEFQEVVTLKGL